MDCLFCQIAAGTIPSQRVYEDEMVLAFRDINPVSPVHILAIPKRHIDSLATVTTEEWPLVTACLDTLNRIAADQGLKQAGYRVVANNGRDGGQTVGHLHWHLLGGRPFSWPPG